MCQIYGKNIRWLDDNSERCHINRSSSVYKVHFETIPSKESITPGLIGITNDIKGTIHSQFYPTKEAAKIAQSTSFVGEYLIIMGLGLGYVCQSMRAKYPEKKIILIEPDIKLFYLAIKHCDLSYINFFRIYVGCDDQSLSHYFSKDLFFKENYDSLKENTYVQKSQECFYGLQYKMILNNIQKRSNFNDLSRLKYPKFTDAQTRIIFIDCSHILTKECLSAIKKTGNLVHYIHLDSEKYGFDNFMTCFVNTISHFKPDFILSINHMGFDQGGRMIDFFDEIEMPFVSWFVDSPDVILSSFSFKISDFCNIFVWDDDYITHLKSQGYKNCDFLPLGTDTEIFYPKKIDNVSKESKRHMYRVSFVGSSMVNAIHKTMKSWVHRDDLLKSFPAVVELFLSQKNRHVDQSVSKFDLRFDSLEQKEDFKSSVLWKGTQIYRKKGIDKLSGFMPVISGDPNWKNILPLEYELLSERWYYDNLCDFYNQSKINFNMTSLQMTNGVNQRVFDVSASRGFLLTDYRSQIRDFFDSKENMVWFDDVNEIPELLRYYDKNNDVREKIATKAYHIVLKSHTYKHRIVSMIDIMKKRYKKIY